MPRPNSGPKLVAFTNTGGKEPSWYIQWFEQGRKRRHSTRIKVASDPNSIQAQEYFQEWLAARAPRPAGPSRSNEILISDVLDLYGTHHGQDVAAPDRIGYAIDRLLGFWQSNAVSHVKGPTCRAYHATRLKNGVGDGTVRRELGVLSAAINWCAAEGYLVDPPRVWRPAPTPAKDRWLTREEVARVIRAARKNPKSREHVPLFILIGVYTCTRKSAILNLRWMANIEGGWFDLERDLLYRQPRQKKQTNKRQTPAPIPPRLKRFLKGHGGHVIQHNGKPLKDIKRAFAWACKEAGVEGVTPHTLRHTGITWMVQRGVPLWQVAGFAGCSVEQIERTYGHHSPEYLDAAKNAFNQSSF